MASPTPDDYTIAWVCALPLEAAAARVMLDKIHTLPQNISDQNAYDVGELNGHNIVIAYLPSGVYGKVSAAGVVSHMRSTFRRLRFALMVGIGGGVPTSGKSDIRLGDVVVSRPGSKHSGVIQYDYGKAVQDRVFEATGTMNKPPPTLLTYMSQLEANEMTAQDGRNRLKKVIRRILKENPHMQGKFGAPEEDTDLLFHRSYRHKDGEESCRRCDKDQLVKRRERETRAPSIHYGLIASGDRVMKDAKTRERLAKEHGILCFEMEAAGLMDELPTLVIRGICDYCDSHKQKQWQGYAALTAAAYARLLLSIVPAYHEEKARRHWMVPLARNRRFVGRKDQIAKLEESIAAQDGPGRVAITGLGGVGKTQIALEVAYRVRERDRKCSVFWVPCVSQAMIEQTLQKIAHEVGLHCTNPKQAKEQVKAYFSSDRAGRWLLIFDNADDPEMWLGAGIGGGAGLESFLPQSDQGHIVFTSRDRKLAMKLAPFDLISVPDVDKWTALEIMRNMLGRKDLLADRTTTALLKQLGFLPLAIAQASAYIVENGRYHEAQNPVITTWLVSFHQIQSQNSTAADYLSFMAIINPRNIPMSLLPYRKTKKRDLDALGLLNAYSFITSEGSEVNMHRLNGQFDHWIQRVADRLEAVFPENNHAERRLWREYLPHALPLMHEEDFIAIEEDYTKLIKAIADCLDSDGRYIEEEVLYKRLVTINKRTNGRKHPSTLSSMGDLATCYLHQGQSIEAEKLEDQVSATSRRKLGGNHPIYMNQGRYDDCAETAPDIERMRSVFGPEDPRTLAAMSLEAYTAHEIFSHERAEQMESEVLEIRQRLYGDEHPDTLKSMHRIAIFRDAQGREDEAEVLATHVLSVRKRVLGRRHPDTLRGMAYLAALHRHRREYRKAEELGRRAVDINRSVWGTEHPESVSSIKALAITLKSHGKIRESMELVKECIRLSNKIWGPDDPTTQDYFEMLRELKGEDDPDFSLWKARKTRAEIIAHKKEMAEFKQNQKDKDRLWDFL
ncbi:hypothetical protein BJY01DRAFT_257138 [Aspergillus pseudoustus]|uniref:NB-ARC domain-containing protein n=1 Tax=Aspergillus pseudoustus TaxID=1810923 RepID=A0ABR4JM65_9EURO